LRMKLNVAPRKGRDWARKLDSLSVPFRMKRWYIRWGVWRWDILSISLRMKLHSAKERNGAHSDFQFLWGWNLFFKLIHIKWWCLSIPLRMKRYIQACDGVGETLPLSIPLRMKPEYKRRIRKISYWATFNSFEDETTMPSRHHYCPTNSFNSFEDETYYYEKPGDVGGYFQFLWGWNTISIKLWNSQWLSFNSFEDETYWM